MKDVLKWNNSSPRNRIDYSWLSMEHSSIFKVQRQLHVDHISCLITVFFWKIGSSDDFGYDHSIVVPIKGYWFPLLAFAKPNYSIRIYTIKISPWPSIGISRVVATNRPSSFCASMAGIRFSPCSLWTGNLSSQWSWFLSSFTKWGTLPLPGWRAEK